MKNQVWIFLLLGCVLAVSGCATDSLTASPVGSTEPLAVEDQATLISALEGSGATVEIGEPVSQVFFSAEGTVLKVNGADVQVFEYESAEEMENEASQVSPDGGSIGTSMVTWVDVPHFYKTNRIIVLYVGNDASVLDVLESALGPQFAGR
jgi:hypothetical protein